ncbi:uncharacterized protein FOMMEDRAFT_72472 [Fomitiporia mediterranea MF3/22]|uniref:uncharacterized protein n=1 Tax=Fomitiporia mediterranea (strain MF3/22) TaxID=694068 RepID=UPI00044097FF|nr:uncharacterized protein FOMMEDRAFT_72472 [Fomitiporia mediterranea MF3/22]EJD07729.1 hypothetical protein FOMMEDRAFT_72472 [Fomitiporia mediterranea MF3/22]
MITFYDIATRLSPQAMAPNTFKTRLALNYKGIPYKTEWVEFPDIEAVVKRLGGTPTSKKADGSDYYTLPMIHDSTTGKVVTDSIAIAEYLDATYPDKPLLFPPGTKAATATLNHVFMQSLNPISPIMIYEVYGTLNQPSQVYWRTTREAAIGKKLEEFAPPGPDRDEMWKQCKEGLDTLAGFYDRNGEGKRFFFADTFSFADTIVIGFLVWIEITLGTTNEEWKAIAGWSNGRWGKLLESTRNLQAVN